jgi:protein-S-isoprenylcysteine O-methyltransferase Ste14
MIVAYSVNLACWLIFLIYWAITARSVKRVKEVKSGFGYVRLIVAIVAFVLLSPTSSGPFGRKLLPQADWIVMLSAVFSILGVTIAIVARRKLAGNWSSGVVFREDHELIQSGLYRYVRHPIYSGIILMALGTALVQGTLGTMLFFLLVLAFMGYKAKQEEELLTTHFPNEYPAYKTRTKRIIPFVW